ncbi:MAG: hypothetical protein IKU86_02545 [Thermoguttaceae bacterium]|nr:hypothetical protein [Thermoguttaceae bacterium]
MRTTAALNRIIDKIAETKPARLESKTRRRDASPNFSDAKTQPSENAAETSSFGPRLAAVDAESLETTRTRRGTKARSADKIDWKNDRPGDANAKTRKTEKFDGSSRSRDCADEEARRTQRRRQIDPTTCERDYSAEEIEFMKALDDYKRASGRMFPTCSEILEVFKSLGYVKIARSEALERSSSQDAKPRRAATPAFLGDEENDPFDFKDAPVPGVA